MAQKINKIASFIWYNNNNSNNVDSGHPQKKEDMPLTHSQLLNYLKKKHEFSDTLANLIPTDVSSALNTNKNQNKNRRKQNKQRRKYEEEHFGFGRELKRSMSPPERVGELVGSIEGVSRGASRGASRGSSRGASRGASRGRSRERQHQPPRVKSPHSLSPEVQRASTATHQQRDHKRRKKKGQKSPQHPMTSAISLYSDYSSQEGDGILYESDGSGGSGSASFYEQSLEDSQGSDYEPDKPWDESDRKKRKRRRKIEHVGEKAHEDLANIGVDKFIRPSSNARWDYDEYGYLWADDESLAPQAQDKFALNRKKKKMKRGGGNQTEKKYSRLMTAYGETVNKKERRAVRTDKRKQVMEKKRIMSLQQQEMSNKFTSTPFDPPEMSAVGGSSLPPIGGGDAQRNVHANEHEQVNLDFDGQFEYLDKQHAVVQNHVYDLNQEKTYQEGKANAIHLGIVWEMEKMKQKLPLAVLQQWGIGGDFAANKSIKVIIRVISKFRHGALSSHWKKWRAVVDEEQQIEFNAKMLLFQQGGAVKTFERIGKRCLKFAVVSGFEQWKRQIERWKEWEANKEIIEAAIVIQRYVKIKQDEARSMHHMRSVVALALHNRRVINMVLGFERKRVGLFADHQRNIEKLKLEDESASVIRRNWNAHVSRGAVFSLILQTRARKAEEQRQLEERMARRLQKNYRSHKDRLGLLLFRQARRKRIEAERLRLYHLEQEKQLGLAEKAKRHENANVIRRAFRCYNFYMRFNKNAYLRKQAKLAQQLLEHRSAKIIQRAFRTHNFLRIFNQKAHERKLRWMAEAEARALKEYNAACFLQECYMRSRKRYSMTLRFNARADMLRDARLLLHQNKCALKIQMAYNTYKGRENLQMKIMKRKLREEEEKQNRLRLAQRKALVKQRARAVSKIQHNFRTYRFLCIFNARAYERKQRWLARQLLEHNMSMVIQKNYRTHRFLTTFNSKAHERKQKWLARQLLEHNSACVIQHNYRIHRFLMAFMKRTHQRKMQWLREAELEAQRKYRVFLGECATKIQRFCARAMERYNQPVRILARRQLEVKRRLAREEKQARDEVSAAIVVQKAWRKKGERDMLLGRFSKRRALLEKRIKEQHENEYATLIQHCYLRHLDRKALRRQVFKRKKLFEKIALHRLRDAKARLLQRNFRLYRGRQVQKLKFEAMGRRLAAERLMEEQTALAEVAARKAAEARMAAEEALKQMVNQGWKLGSDAHGRNYWYNWITGESTWTKPAGWKIKATETWVKNQDSMGNTYYYNQLTNETKWMPPCSICQKEEGKRICETCDFAIYCLNCYERIHNEFPDEGKDHLWKAADIDKDTLKPGEKYCIKCNVTAAKRACKVCRDAYCDRCFREVHAVGWLSKHPWVTWEEFKNGWTEVKGRVDGERTYYFNAKTGESSHEKPEELMLEEELREYKLHKKFEKENEKNIKKIEKLSEKVLQFEYERDQLWFEANMKKTADKEELELLRAQLEAQEQQKRDRYKRMLLHPYQFYQEYKKEKKRAEQLYRRKLLLSAKQRSSLGMNDAPVAVKAEETTAD